MGWLNEEDIIKNLLLQRSQETEYNNVSGMLIVPITFKILLLQEIIEEVVSDHRTNNEYALKWYLFKYCVKIIN